MMSKSLINRSLSAVYKEILLDESSTENEQLKEEVRKLASDTSLFSEEEIIQNQQQLDEIDYISEHQVFVCHTDGAVIVRYDDIEAKTGKSTRAAASFTIESEGDMLFQNYFPIPTSYSGKDTSSHMAEYQAFISCLRVLSMHHPDPSLVSVKMLTDSTVLVKQINLEYRVRDEVQREMRKEALHYIKKFKDVSVEYIPREENELADKLASMAIEEKEWISQNEKEATLSRNRKRD